MAAANLKSTKFDLLGTLWSLIVRPFKEEPDGSPAALHGYCRAESAEIHVNSLIAKAYYPDTVLHELLHAIESAGGFTTDEPRVRYTATALRAFFKANPKLAGFITT